MRAFRLSVLLPLLWAFDVLAATPPREDDARGLVDELRKGNSSGLSALLREGTNASADRIPWKDLARAVLETGNDSLGREWIESERVPAPFRLEVLLATRGERASIEALVTFLGRNLLSWSESESFLRTCPSVSRQGKSAPSDPLAGGAAPSEIETGVRFQVQLLRDRYRDAWKTIRELRFSVDGAPSPLSDHLLFRAESLVTGLFEAGAYEEAVACGARFGASFSPDGLSTLRMARRKLGIPADPFDRAFLAGDWKEALRLAPESPGLSPDRVRIAALAATGKDPLPAEDSERWVFRRALFASDLGPVLSLLRDPSFGRKDPDLIRRVHLARKIGLERNPILCGAWTLVERCRLTLETNAESLVLGSSIGWPAPLREEALLAALRIRLDRGEDQRVEELFSAVQRDLTAPESLEKARFFRLSALGRLDPPGRPTRKAAFLKIYPESPYRSLLPGDAGP